MKRSEFIRTAGVLSTAPLFGMTNSTSSNQIEKNQYLELIKYTLHPGVKQKNIEKFFSDVAIPALNRIGIPNVGVFNSVFGPDSLSLFVLIPHKTLEGVFTDNEKLMADKEYLSAGEIFLHCPIDNTAFVKMEKTLLRTFDKLPFLKIPDNLINIQSRIYELRIYQSPSAVAAKRKIEMFNEGNEIELFNTAGLQAVFFGETIIGQQMPNLHYMLVFENMEARDKYWNQFRTNQDWLKLKSDQYYANLVSSTTDIILKPASCSQI